MARPRTPSPRTLRRPRVGFVPAQAARGVRPRRDDRGAAAVEMVLLVPAVMLLVALFVYGYRLWSTQAAVLSAAESAARAATLAHGAGEARGMAEDAAASNLQTLGVRCAQRGVSVDASALALPAGQQGSVRVDIHCTVSMADLLLPGAPGSVDIDRSATEQTNRFTERHP